MDSPSNINAQNCSAYSYTFISLVTCIMQPQSHDFMLNHYLGD